MAAVGRDAVDGALVTLQLSQSSQGVRVPQLEHPSSAAAQQGRRPGDDAERADPVSVGVGDLLLETSSSRDPAGMTTITRAPNFVTVPAAGLCGPGPTS